MFLKLLVKQEQKEVSLPENIKNLPQLKSEVGRVVNADPDDFLLSFIDVDDEVVEIKDEYDFEYMLEQSKQGTVVHLNALASDSPKPVPLPTVLEQAPAPARLTGDLPEDPCQQILTEQFMNSLKAAVEETEPAPAEETAAARDSLLSLTVVQKMEDQLQVPAMETTLDLSVIKMSESPKFETVDTRYDFTKQKATVAEQAYIEEGIAQPLPLPLPVLPKEQLEEVMKSNKTLQDLRNKIDLLTDVVNQGFSGIRSELDLLALAAPKEQPKPAVETPQHLHYGVSCDHCRTKPIRGKRFKCLLCPDFDLCAICEEKNVHKHPKLVFFEPTNIPFAEQMTSLYRLKSNIWNLSDLDLKIRVLRNIAGEKYPDAFYQSFVDKRKEKSVIDFIDEVLKIFG